MRVRRQVGKRGLRGFLHAVARLELPFDFDIRRSTRAPIRRADLDDVTARDRDDLFRLDDDVGWSGMGRPTAVDEKRERRANQREPDSSGNPFERRYFAGSVTLVAVSGAAAASVVAPGRAVSGMRTDARRFTG